ncbi:MAG: thioredoxin family protein [Anaerolineae bacterium]
MAKPVVDGIEREAADRSRVVRIDATSAQGSELAQRFGVRGVPTVLVFDGSGTVVLSQVGRISRLEVINTITHLMAQPS